MARIPKPEYRHDSYDPAPSANRGSRGRGVGLGLLTHGQLAEAFLTSATAARIVSCVPDEMFRVGFDIEVADGTVFDDKKFRSLWDTLQASKRLSEALLWARLDGGGAVLVAGPAAEMQRFTPGESVDFLRSVSCTEMQPYPGFESAYDPDQFGFPEMWGITPVFGGTDIQVHNSRLVKMSGRPIPAILRKNMNSSQRFFGLSCLQGVLADVFDFDDCHQWASLLMKRLQQLVYASEGAGDLCESRAGRNSLQAKLDFVDGVRSAANTMAIDKDNDQLTLLQGSLQGVKDVLDTKKARITQGSGIPQIVLSGDASGGLNNSAEGAMRSWQEYIAREQENVGTPAVSALVSMLYPDLADFSIKWRPLEEETLSQLAERLYKQSQADGTYTEKYILTVDEVRNTLAKRGDYVMGKTKPVPPLPQEPSADETVIARG